MQKLINLVTTNPGKVESVRRTLELFGIRLDHTHHDLAEPRSDNLEVIAKAKAKEAFALFQRPCIAIDAGFQIHALDGYPGPLVNPLVRKVGIRRLLRMMDSEPRVCAFEDCVAYNDGKIEIAFSAQYPGTLALSERGEIQPWSWSPLDLIFVPEGENKTLAEMAETERNDWRIRKGDGALMQFARWYLTQNPA